MELIKSGPLPENMQLYIIGDTHMGALNCSESSIRQLIDTISSEDDSYMVHLGDAIECILPNDKRFATCSVDWQRKCVTPEEQAEAVVRLFSPLKGRILAWLMGNHEYKLVNSANFARMMAMNLDAPYGSAVCKLHLQFAKRKPIKFMLAHGSGAFRSQAKDAIQREANVKAALKQKLHRLAGDCVGMFCGHGHHMIAVDPTVEKELYLTDDGKKIKQHYHVGADQSAAFIPPDSRWYGMTGSFLRLFSPPGSEAVGYGEIALYSPAEIGCLVAIIRKGKMVKLEKVVF